MDKLRDVDQKFLKFRDYVNINEIDKSELFANSNAIEIIKKIPEDKINFYKLSSNKNALDIIFKNIYKIDYCWLENNDNDLIINVICGTINIAKYDKYPEIILQTLKNLEFKTSIDRLLNYACCKNSKIIKKLISNDKFILETTKVNTYDLYSSYERKQFWYLMSYNPHLTKIYYKKPDIWTICLTIPQLDWNIIPYFIHDKYFIKAHKRLIKPEILKEIDGLNEMEVFEIYYKKYYNKNNTFSDNPNIFTYDYDKIKETKHDINKELIEWIWKPKHYKKWIDWQL